MIVNQVIPMVVEQGHQGERAYDIYSLLLKERLVMMGSPVNQQSANLLIAQLLYLSREDPKKPIQLYISSPGGEVYPGMAIYDTMQQIEAPVSTTAVGMTASFGTVLLIAGSKGLRYALPHATIHLHQPLGGTQGQVTDMLIQVNEFLRLKAQLIEVFVKHTGQNAEVIERDMDRDLYKTPMQAVEYGLIDAILNHDKVAPLMR
ncbi:MAG: ATP-dependent Clp protease proteolytic subunit [Anaerolineae bacterium]|jgi:ATP-dependent Clp protease protease subunit|nr:ATP-dependent Clp protease proteolytic subunit [Anaerolineae bacterium]